MTRPASHREQEHPNRCGNCCFAKLLAYKGDWLCTIGDEHMFEHQDDGRVVAYAASGDCINFMEGDEYDEIWGGSVVDPSSDVCDEWSSRERIDEAK
jgi:hypothetical protein